MNGLYRQKILMILLVVALLLLSLKIWCGARIADGGIKKTVLIMDIAMPLNMGILASIGKSVFIERTSRISSVLTARGEANEAD